MIELAPAHCNPWELTERQCQAVEALVRTGCNNEVCAELGIGIVTVTNLLSRACRKVGVKNRVQLALVYDRWKAGRAEA